MKKWNILGVVVFQTELHTDIPVLEHYSSLNFLASLPMKRPATLGGWYSWNSSTANHTPPCICVMGAIGSWNGHLWTRTCLGWGMNKEVWYEAKLSFEIFHFRKIFNPICAFTTELCRRPATWTLPRHLPFGLIMLYVTAFRLFF